MISFLVDDIVVALLFVVIFSSQIATLQGPEAIRAFLEANLWVLILLKILYHTFFTAYNGMTLGKYLVKIRAVSAEDGALLTPARSLLRASIRILDEMFFYLGFLPAFFSPMRQTLHDQLSGCVVVHA
jgi:uncharacterized RDD family membrane protein YckC